MNMGFMRKILLFTLPILLLTGCGNSLEKEDVGVIKSSISFDKEIEIMVNKMDDKKIELICAQDFIPSEYASACFFRSLKHCESSSGLVVKNSEIEKCLPVFLNELIQNSAE